MATAPAGLRHDNFGGGFMGKQAVSATLDEELLEKLDQFAEETERNRSWLIGKALEVYFEELEDLKVAKERLGNERLSPRAMRKEVGV